MKPLLKLKRENSFLSDLKREIKRGLIYDDIEPVISMLQKQEILPLKYHDHTLKGDLKGFRECHIKTDLLLIYRITKDELYLVRMGSHSDLF